MKPISALALALTVAPACHDSSDGSAPDFLQPGANNLGLIATQFRIDGDTLVAKVVEGPGRDLNGDGDMVDAVLEVIDLRSGRQRLLPMAANLGFELDGGFVSFVVVECAQGEDLDGDGDVDCSGVLFVHDIAANRTDNLELPLGTSGRGPFLAQEGALIALGVSESGLGRDLDGDGQVTHNFVFVYEADLRRLTSLHVATNLHPIVEDGRVFVAALEEGHGDKNGDGDALDSVLFVYDARTGATQNLARAVFPFSQSLPWLGVEGPLLALRVAEFLQGADQNDDGDELDTLVEIHDLESGLVVPTDLPANELTLAGGLVGIFVPEFSFQDPVGFDLDGDGERLHTVAFFYDWFTGTMANTGIAVDSWAGFPYVPPVLGDRRAGFLAIEKVDANGDGDTDDRILHVFDARTGLTESTGLVVPRWAGVGIGRRHLACAAFEGANLECRVVDLSTGAQTGVGLSSVQQLSVDEERVLIAVYEQFEGVDLNGDGDQSDIVQQVHDLATGSTFNTALAVSSFDGFSSALDLEGRRLALLVPEGAQGQDLNEDGDMEDFVLHVVRLP